MSATKKTVWIRVFSLLLVCLLLGACAKPEDPQTAFPEVEFTTPKDANYKTITVEEGEYISSMGSELAIANLRTAELSWDQSGATFVESFVRRGQQVKKGDILMTFETKISKVDSVELRQQRETAWNNFLAGKESRLAAIEAAKQRAEELTGFDQEIEYFKIEKLQAQYDDYVFRTTRSVYAIDDQIRALEGKAENNVLLAPFDGVIDGVVKLNPGDAVPVRSALITMHAKEESALLRAKDTAKKLRYNMPITIESRNGDDSVFYTGRVITASNILPASVSSDLVLVEFEEPVLAEDLGMYLTYKAENEVLKGIITIPRNAVKTDKGKNYVYLLENGTIQKRFISIFVSSNTNAWVQDGLSVGQTVVID